MGQLYYSPISINSGQVPSTQTDFPVLVSQTDNRFKTTGNGGHVANANGYDIRPYSDSGLTTAITGYELERYNASTGEVIMWVKVASLSSSTTPIYLGYGDTSLITDGSSTTTWSNNFLAVFHFPDGSSLGLNDSTGRNSAAGTVNTPTATSGKIDGAVNLVHASGQYVVPQNSALINAAAMTYSAWVNASSFPAAYNAVIAYVLALGTRYFELLVTSGGKLALYLTNSAGTDIHYDGTGSHTLSTSTDYYLTMSYDSSAGLIGYVNGASDGSAAANGSLDTGNNGGDIGNDPVTSGRTWDGKIDEARISSVARSADWITTEYNNQSAPGTFETLGTEVSLSQISGLYRS